MDGGICLSPMTRPNRDANPLLRLTLQYSSDTIRLPKPIAIPRDPPLDRLCDGSRLHAVVRHIDDTLAGRVGPVCALLVPFVLFLLLLLVRPFFFGCWLP